jgi:uncharacterized protein (DUF58 family)
VTSPVRSDTGRWLPTAVTGSWALGGVGLALLGLLLARADVVAIGAPLLLGIAMAFRSRPTGRGEATIEDLRHAPDARVRANLILHPPQGAELALLRVSSPSHRHLDVAVAAVGPVTVPVSVSGVRTGRQEFFHVTHQVISVGHLARTLSRELGPARLTVLPRPQPLDRLPLPPRLQGLTGAHDSRRVGDGGDLHDIAPFAPGDRLRRIDWRVTLRESGRGRDPGLLTALHVRRTFATADAIVTLVLDSRDDIARDIGTWSGYGEVHPDDATSLDVARQAAASVAKAYLDAGDRVGLLDLGREGRPIQPAGGRRHLIRIMHALAESTPSGAAGRIVRPPQAPSGALIVVFSTFLDDQAAELATSWRRHGHRVLAVDVLPPLIDEPRPASETNLHRVIELEQADRLWDLERAGVETVHWHEAVSGHPSLAVGLTMLARQRRRFR